MTTQSKSVLLPFLIIAGILFAAALGWKFFGSAEESTKSGTQVVQETTQSQPAVNVEPTNNSTPVAAVTKEVEPEPFLAEIPATREEAKEMASNNMRMAMRYQTAEKALAAMKDFHEQGNEEMVKKLITFMTQAYPNTAIPSEFLD